MFECLTRRLTPTGWPAEVEIRELVADDVLPIFMDGTPDPHHVRRLLVHLATWTLDGERVFKTPEAVGKVPARFVAGLTEITNEVMRMNTPHTSQEEAGNAVDGPRPT